MSANDSADPTKPPPRASLRFDWSFLVGYDFFISYRRSDARLYATSLAQLLERADFRCFLDDNEAVPGKPLTERLRRALLRSRTLVVVASPELDQSPWVPQELAIFEETRGDIVPINIRDGLQRALQAGKPFALLRSRDALWIDEPPAVGPGDTPSSHVIGKLQMNFHYGKANRRLRWIIGAVMGCLVGLGIAAFWQMRIAQERLEVSTSQALAADARRQVTTELHEALHTALEAFDRRPSIEAQTALLECLNRAQRIRRILPCSDGEKAVGVAFSPSTPPLLAVASHAFGDGASRTIVRVVDMDGSLLRTVTVSGDARVLAFSDVTTLSMVHAGTVTTLDLASGVTEDSRVPPSAAPVGGTGNADLSAPLPCEQEHPKGLRYFTAAETADRRFHAYTTEGNEIIVHDRTTGVCDEPLRAHTHNILALAWSEDGRYLASAGAIADGDSRHGFIVWDRQQIHPAATRIQELQQSGAGVTAISANGGSWIVGGIGRTLLWDHTVSPLPAGLDGVRLAALRDDGGEAAVANWDGKWMRLRRTRNGIEVLEHGKSEKSLLGLLYHGAQLVIVDADGKILGGGLTPAASNLRTGRREIQCVGTAASDGPMALVERDAKGRLFVGVVDLERAIESPFPVPMSNCGALAHAPRQRLAILASANYEPAFIVPLDGKAPPTAILNPLRSESGLPTILSYLALSSDARRAFGLSNGRDIAIFDIPTRRFVGALAIGEAAGIAVSRDGSRAISASGGKVALWTLQPGDWRIQGGRLLDGGRTPWK